MDKRKTDEKPTSRISRLAQPRKYSATPHTVGKIRSSSTENLTLSNNTTFKRARSACSIETPARTPIGRSMHAISTPASVYKKAGNEKIIRILRVLRNHFDNHFLPDGLHTMTAKQFTEIMKYFAQVICDNKFQQTSIQENNIDTIKKFVDFVDYPNQVNKSWYKTPTLQTVFDRIVDLLDWLCDFVMTNKEPNDTVMSFEIEHMLSDVGDVFQNAKYLETFVREVKNNHQLWSDQKPEFEEFKFRLTESLIYQKTGLTDIDAHIARVENEQEELLNKQMAFQKDNQLQTQKNKSQQLQNEVNQLKVRVDENEIVLQEKSLELTSSIARNEALKKKIAELQHVINNQKFTASDRHRVALDLEQKKHLLKEKQEMVTVLQNISWEHQVKIARLKKQKVSTIYGYNTMVQKLFQTEEVVDFDGIKMEQLLIHENYNMNRIIEVLKLCEGVKKVIAELRKDVCASLTASEINLQSIGKKLYEIEDTLSDAKKEERSLENQIQKLDYEMSDIKYASEQEQKQLQCKIDALLHECEQNDSKLETIVAQSKVVDKENEKINFGIQLKAEEMMDAKLRRMARRNVALLELENVAEQLRGTVTRLQKSSK